MPPVVVPSGMRTSFARGGVSAGGAVVVTTVFVVLLSAGLIFAPVGGVVVENEPGGPAGAVDAAPDSGSGVSVPGTRTMVRDGVPGRRVLVDIKPVRPAPDPAGLPKLGIWLFSGLPKVGSVPAACVPPGVVQIGRAHV